MRPACSPFPRPLLPAARLPTPIPLSVPPVQSAEFRATSHSFPEVPPWGPGAASGHAPCPGVGRHRCSLGGPGNMEMLCLVPGFKDVPIVSAAHPGWGLLSEAD